ncbi:MAG: ABC transporter ATP-binding protein [Nitrospinota bacterium]
MAEDGLVLRTERLTKHFGGLSALQDVDFNMPGGELRAIIGPNGAGKTTFFNLLCGILHPTRGRVYFEGRDITGMSMHRISRLGIARTMQIKSVFGGMRVRDNVWVAVQSRQRFMNPFAHYLKYRDIAKRVDEILDMVGLREHSGELAQNLAYGDLCLLEMGVALGTNPKLLLLDEPVSGMSPGETERTVETIKRLSERIDVVLIEHDMDVVLSIADRITVLHFGQIIAEGTPAEIMKDRRVQEAYLGRDEDA